MRLSEAILLGSTLIRAKRGTIGGGRGEPGCAIGMALEAVGIRRTPILETDYWPEALRERMFRHWEWSENEGSYITPCDCALERPTFTRVIIHLFDNHVERITCKREPWSLEELVGYVARMEDELAAAYEATESQAMLEEQPEPVTVEEEAEEVEVDEVEVDEEEVDEEKADEAERSRIEGMRGWRRYKQNAYGEYLRQGIQYESVPGTVGESREDLPERREGER